MKDLIAVEREQLLAQWKSAFQRNPDWFSREVSQVQSILRLQAADVKQQAGLGDYIRKFHDRLGFMAKGHVSTGGLCAGAIYRSTRFIQTSERSGAKKSQTVHIEHTVPVRVLRTSIVGASAWTYPALLIWLFKHSVATALHIEEERHIEPERRFHSGALMPGSIEYQLPFMRYENLFRRGAQIWNVLSGSAIDPHKFSFDDHFAEVVKLLRLIDARPMVAGLSQSGEAKV